MRKTKGKREGILCSLPWEIKGVDYGTDGRDENFLTDDMNMGADGGGGYLARNIIAHYHLF